MTSLRSQGAPDISIRRYQDGDARALWAVFHGAIHGIACADYTPEQLEVWAPAEIDESKWEARVRGIAPFVAESGGSIVGYADVQGTGLIDHFFIAPPMSRRGVGSRLMQRLHEEAAEKRLPLLFSNVSLTARPFFEKWGFSLVAAQTVTMRGVILNNFSMQKRLLQKEPD